MSRSLILSFNSAVAKYSRLTKKVKKSISKGEFWRYTKRKRHHLLARLERLRRRIVELSMQAKLAGAGIAAALLMMSTGNVSAQPVTPLGPFVANPVANPFPPPAFYPVTTPFVTFLDIDFDGDLDAVITEAYGSHNPYYYINNGDAEHPIFESTYLGGISWYSGAQKARIAFADVDDDGDLDAVVGMDRTSSDDYSLGTDSLYFFRNTAGPSTFPDFQVDNTGTNPFAGIRLKRQGWPAFTDYDNDGDLDLVVTGEYDDESTGKTAWLQFFRNDKVGHDAGVDVTYTPLQTPANNPLYLGENPTVGFYGISFADLDGDGDDDWFAIDQHGQMTYRRNDGNGVFTQQVGNYVYKPNGASTGNPLQIDGVIITTPDSYKCLAFGDLDGDGDKDLVIGNNNIGTLNSQYIYVENTGNGVMVPDNSRSNPISGFTMGGNGNGRFFDYDKDGDNDFIATGHITVPDGGEVSTKDVVGHAFFKNEAGHFDLQEDVDDAFDALSVDGTAGNWSTADVDGDGDMDALYIHTEYDVTTTTYFLAIEYYRNDNGTFVVQAAPDNAFAPLMAMPYFGTLLDIADINSDGLPDIVLSGGGDLPKFFKNTGQVGNAAFVEEPAWQDGLVTTEALAPKLVDLDGDGDTDMVLGKYFYVWYYENIGTPATPKWVEYQDSSPNNPFASVSLGGSGGIWPEVADVDGDGDKDFLPGKDGMFGYFRNDNPAPVITSGENKNILLVVNQAVDLDPVITITDSDGDKIVKTTITISPYNKGQEKLQVPAASSYPNLTILWDDQAGQLTISGSSTVADHQDALQDVQYLYTGPSSSGRVASGGARTIAKTITVTTLDADQTIGSSNTTTYTVGHTNIAPVITPSSFNATFTSAAVPVLPSIVLSDADDVMLASAQVSFHVSSYKAAEDRLQVTLTGGISASFDQATGILTLTGAGTVADYQAALQAIQYSNAGATATAGTRTLTVKVNDGEVDSNVGTAQLTVNSTVPPTNTPPTISGTSSQFYTTGDLVINNNIIVADVDGVLTGATVGIISGFASGEDMLVFADQNGITGNYQNSTGVLTLTGSSSVANYQSALRSVKYRNKAAEPNTTDRAITFTVTDGNPAVSLTGTVITINKPPVIKTVTKKQAASDGNVGFPISALSDPDGNLDLTTLQVTSEKGNVIVADGIITVDYSARGNTKDIDHITITVCDTGGRCKTQDIEVELGAAAIIYTGMSPNGDGVNDWFYIENLPLHTHVAVYDRWGDAIFQTEEYDMTEPSQRFEGKNKNGTDVIAGSYFYKVKFTDSNTVKTGYIILNR